MSVERERGDDTRDGRGGEARGRRGEGPNLGRGEGPNLGRGEEPQGGDGDERADARRRWRGPRPREALAVGLAAAASGLLGAGMALRPRPTPAAAPRRKKPDPQAEMAHARSTRWDLPAVRNDRVDFFIEFLMGKNHDKTRAWLERVGRYGPMIREKLRERGMPEDLLYLAMIESGLNPNAYSSADAAGLWQFIAPTGERYGLEVSRWVDQRRDPLKATDAALTYLQELHDRFGSWYLAAAAYNTGENRVARILDEKAGGARGDDSLYWKIAPDLPRETRDYVPVMLAMGYIAKDPARYGFADLQHQTPLRFEPVTVAGGTSLDDVARAAGADAATIAELNPQLVRGSTPPGRSWRVRVPLGAAAPVLALYAPEGAAAPGTRRAD